MRKALCSLLADVFAHQPQYNEGKVIATGQGRRTLTNGEVIPVAVKEGDKVLLPDYGGTQLKLDGKE